MPLGRGDPPVSYESLEMDIHTGPMANGVAA